MRVVPGAARTPAGRFDAGLIRLRLVCRGAVQGVGFRPAVWRLARALGLSGLVRNDPDGATIEVQGEAAAVARFRARLPDALPPLARLAALEEGVVPVLAAERAFAVVPSTGGARRRALIPPDAATCPACRAELDDPADRRHRYPFTNCTDCGPRFTLAVDLPYDRSRTSMARFPLCSACAAEYADPGDRRFHAEPLCCPACGPRVVLAGRDGARRASGDAALAAAGAALAGGRIVALKGLGGFLLACRADDDRAVGRLRSRKRRPTKPFALVVRDVEVARGMVVLTDAEEELLTGPRGPILLAPRRPAAPVSKRVAPGIDDLGVMLPTTPLHAELFRDAPYPALVATSGNRGDEPICRVDAEALERLADVADLFLLHDREIVRRADDSVVRTARDGPRLVRRSRGWVPEPVALAEAAPAPVLALGGHLQVTACLAVDDEAFPSQHVGDLDTDAARAFLVEVAEGLEAFLQVRAKVIVVDEHPDYPSAWIGARIARTRGARLLRVQHHLAHAAAVLAEHRALPGPGERAGALVLDGTGYGPDGTAWGTECLLLDGDLAWRRAARAEPLLLVGAERAVREPWRVAVAALVRAGEASLVDELPLATRVDPTRLSAVRALAERDGWPLASGAGRLFEAAGALLGLCVENGWEGEAAARLEACASRATDAPAPWPEVARDEARTLPSRALLAAAARRIAAGEPAPLVASGFHATFARLAARTARAALPEDVRVLALGGGCLVNRLLARDLSRELGTLGFTPLLPRALPPGDGGLSFGQAALASLALARDTFPRLEGGP